MAGYDRWYTIREDIIRCERIQQDGIGEDLKYEGIGP